MSVAGLRFRCGQGSSCLQGPRTPRSGLRDCRPGRFAAGFASPPAVCRSVGQDSVGAWVDLASFVAASSSGAKSPYDELADKIGRECYIDVAGWHLYLKDVRLVGISNATLAQGLASQLGPQVRIASSQCGILCVFGSRQERRKPSNRGEPWFTCVFFHFFFFFCRFLEEGSVVGGGPHVAFLTPSMHRHWPKHKKWVTG